MHVTWLKNRTATRALDNKMPYEMLYKKAPNLKNLPVWGCRIKVHSSNSSKLDMQAINGKWVGFDRDSNSHRIYLPDTRQIAVERSVIFDITEVVHCTVQGYDDASILTPPVTTQNTTPPTQDHLGPQFEGNALPHRSTRVQIESAYIKSLRDGTGTTDGRNTDLPRGMQPAEESSNLAVELGMVGEYGEMDEDDEEIFVMVAGVAAVEGTDPTTVKEASARNN